MNEVKDFEKIRNKIILVGRHVLPKGSNDPDPEKAMLASLGCIPDTQEWLETKIAYLDPTDDEGFREWAQYVLEKAIEAGVAV